MLAVSSAWLKLIATKLIAPRLYTSSGCDSSSADTSDGRSARSPGTISMNGISSSTAAIRGLLWPLTMPNTSYPWSCRNSARCWPSWPVIPVMNARGNSRLLRGSRGTGRVYGCPTTERPATVTQPAMTESPEPAPSHRSIADSSRDRRRAAVRPPHRRRGRYCGPRRRACGPRRRHARSVPRQLPVEAAARPPPAPGAGLIASHLWSRTQWPRVRPLGERRRHHPRHQLRRAPTRLPAVVSVYDCWFLAIPNWPRRSCDAPASGCGGRSASGALRARQLRRHGRPCALDVRYRPGRHDPARPAAGPTAAGRRCPRRPPLTRSRGDPFVLAIGTEERRKALPMLVEAFAPIAAEHRQLRLVLAGAPGDDSAGVDARDRSARSRRPGSRAARSGPSTRPPSIGCLRRASVLAYPSLDEGFGFPILEAQLAGDAGRRQSMSARSPRSPATACCWSRARPGRLRRGARRGARRRRLAARPDRGRSPQRAAVRLGRHRRPTGRPVPAASSIDRRASEA